MANDYHKDGTMKLRRRIKFNHRTKEWKKAVIARDGKCMNPKCGSTENLTAHHIIKIGTLIKRHQLKTIEDAYKCEELWDISLGKCLCNDCHVETHQPPKEEFTETEKKRGWKLHPAERKKAKYGQRDRCTRTSGGSRKTGR